MQSRILHGDCREVLRDLPAESVHCVVTSPPYWGLRSYGGDEGMIGLEPTFDEHLENLVAVFREVRRVLRDDGTLWLNYGDAYAGAGRTSGAGEIQDKHRARSVSSSLPPVDQSSFKSKDLMMMPARVAMALQADGWWLRSEIVWHKPNPMPESVTDRPTNAHEKMFLLSKRATYFYDADAVRLEPSGQRQAMNFGKPSERQDGDRSYAPDGSKGANLRNVWTIPTHSYKGAHFATFPPALVEPCIKAGTSERGVCGECGASWKRQVERTAMEIRRSQRTHDKGRTRSSGTMIAPATANTTGWAPTCEHKADPVPAVVLDCFAGSGTVGHVSLSLGRSFIGVEINAEYVAMGEAADGKRGPSFH